MSGWAIGRVLGARDVIEDEIVIRQESSLMSLMTVQDFCKHDDFEILVIEANVDKVLRSFEIVHQETPYSTIWY